MQSSAHLLQFHHHSPSIATAVRVVAAIIVISTFAVIAREPVAISAKAATANAIDSDTSSSAYVVIADVA